MLLFHYIVDSLLLHSCFECNLINEFLNKFDYLNLAYD